MASYTLSPIGGAGWQFFDNNGVPLAGGKIYTYAAGTTTPQTTWTTPAGTTANANPIILDSAGRPPQEIWLNVAYSYKFSVETSTGILIRTYDNIPGLPQPAIVNDASSISYEQGNTVTAGSFVIGRTYMIASVGSTDFVAIGATANSTGVLFVATGAGSGTGTAYNVQTVEAKLRQTVSVKDFGAVGDGVTDDAAAVQDAIDYVQTLGGNLYFPKGVYLFGSQVTIDRTYAPSGGNFVGERNLIISGYGAEIRTTGAISAFDVKGGWLPNHNCLIEGFTIYHRGNTQAVAGIRMIGAGLVTCREVSVVVSSTLPAGYAAFSMENSVPADPNTGCFWNLIDQCSIRPWSGAEGNCTYGVKLMGSANATTLRNNNFSGSDTHVVLMAHPGQVTAPNSVNIDGNFFEGPTSAIAISLVSSGVTYHVNGTRITNNRFEAIDTAVSLTGTGTTVQLPTYMSANYADTGVTNYIVNASNIPIVMLDFDIVGAPMGPARMVNNDGVVIEAQDSAANPLALKVPSIGKGLELRRTTGDVFLGSIRYSNVAGGIGMQIAGSWSPDYRPLTIVGCQGIAARDTPAQNLAGTSSFAASTTKLVTLPNPETNASYLIFLEPRANQKLWVSSRTATDFTVESDVSSSNGFGWLLVRHL